VVCRLHNREYQFSGTANIKQFSHKIYLLVSHQTSDLLDNILSFKFVRDTIVEISNNNAKIDVGLYLS